MEQKSPEKPNFMLRLATFIVDKRSLMFLLVGIALVFSLFSRGWVKVENELTAFLPLESNTRKGLDLMEQQFITYGTAKIMVANVSYEEAEALYQTVKAVDGVQSVEFDRTTEHYNKASALFTVTYDCEESDPACKETLETLRGLLVPYDTYVSASIGDTLAALIAQEVSMIIAFVAVIVVLVLTLTSQSYAEVPVIGLTFIVAAILNAGTNFLLGTISFVSNSVTTILQLALSLDYAVIYCNRFKEERERHELREAVIVSLSKAIPEVGASSLTTIGGLFAMLFMQFRLGPDMGVNLIKAVFFSLLSVFTVMPGLLMLMGKLMDRTRHKSFMPKMPFIGRFAYATRYVIPPVFVLVIALAIYLSNRCPYVFGYDTLSTPRLNEVQVANKLIDETFSSRNMLAVVVPGGDYSEEQSLIRDLEQLREVDSVVAIANSDAIGGYKLADKLSPREFAELMKLDYETAEFVYAAYAVKNEKYDKLVSGIAKYRIPLIDMLLYVGDKVDEGYITLEGEQAETLSDAQRMMRMAKQQLEGEDYDRMLVYYTVAEAGDATYRFTDTLRDTAQAHYPKGQVFVVGDATNQYEFKKSFQTDNIVVSIMSILIVLVVLLFTFKSVGMPVLLILVIQGSIWINFSYPTLAHRDVFFMTQLVVSAIQMGANIDYAIVIASRYREDIRTMQPREAIIETMSFAFPAILTSGTILAVSGVLVSILTTECTINGIGEALGRGTVISLVLVMFVLPQLLVLSGKILEKTSFSMPRPAREQKSRGLIAVDGLIVGEIHGTVNGVFRGTIDGDADLRLLSGQMGSAEERGEELCHES